jgi:hypothetical protein
VRVGLFFDGDHGAGALVLAWAKAGGHPCVSIRGREHSRPGGSRFLIASLNRGKF